MKKKICSLCKYEYDSEIVTHYCPNCGKNISGIIEKSDCILAIASIFRGLGIFGVIFFTIPGIALMGICIDGSCFDVPFTYVPVLSIILGFVLREYGRKVCKKNIQK